MQLMDDCRFRHRLVLFSSCLTLGALYSICTFSLLVITFSSVACAVCAVALIVSAHCL